MKLTGTFLQINISARPKYESAKLFWAKLWKWDFHINFIGHQSLIRLKAISRSLRTIFQHLTFLDYFIFLTSGDDKSLALLVLPTRYMIQYQEKLQLDFDYLMVSLTLRSIFFLLRWKLWHLVLTVKYTLGVSLH